MSRGENNVVLTDELVNEIFAKNHGAEARAYYAERPIRSGGSMWNASEELISMAGRPSVGRVHSAGGAQ